ncbi:MAG: rhomboid family intramembrane serine protease [Bacteroidales bacterium]|nr:rhomboid family intramembrane serine protease [Bacteroidales bacterium]
MNRFQTTGFGNIPPVVKNLLIINVLLLIATYVLGNFGIDLVQKLGLFYFKSEYFSPYQFVTHMFMHGGIAHLFFNMFALWMFGKVLESVWGSKRFLIYYFITGLGAAALHTFVNWINLSSIENAANAFYNTPSPELFSTFIREYISNPNPEVYDFIASWSSNPANNEYINHAVRLIEGAVKFKMNIPTVGASGAVFGVLLAFGMLFPNTQLMLLFPPIPIKAKYFVILYGILELYLGVSQQPGDNVAHFAHLGGMLFGFILIKYWNKKGRSFY